MKPSDRTSRKVKFDAWAQRSQMLRNKGGTLAVPEAPELGSALAPALLGSAAAVLPTSPLPPRGFSSRSVLTVSDRVLLAFSGCHPKQL